MAEQEHNWGPVDDNDVSTCVNCDAKRRGEAHNFYYQQWWGGWHLLMEPACASIERREEFWKTEKQVAERKAAVNLVVRENADLRDLIRRVIEVGDSGGEAQAMVNVLRDEGNDSNGSGSWEKTLC